MKLTLDTDAEVFFYEQEFYPLSNFSAFQLRWKGLIFQTSEAAYQWEKFPSCVPLQNDILYARSAHEAYKLAERYKTARRKDWDQVKVQIMLEILTAKAIQHSYVLKKLIETGDRYLCENSWRDSFWGWGPDRKGRNMLGTIWMEIREKANKEGLA